MQHRIVQNELKFRWLLIIALVITSLFSLLVYSNVYTIVQNTVSSPINFFTRSALGKSPRLHPMIKIYALDDISVDFLNRSDMTITEWANVLQGMAESGPSVIYVDKLFSAPQGDGYKHFNETIKAINIPVVSAAYVTETPIHGKSPIALDQALFSLHKAVDRGRFSILEESDEDLEWLTVRPASLYGPHRNIAPALNNLGHAIYHGQGLVQPLIRVRDDKVIPHMSFIGRNKYYLDKGAIYINQQKVPLNREGKILANLVNIDELRGRTFSFKSSIARARRGMSFDSVIKPGQIVVILPAMYTGNTDMVPTPIGYIPGGYVMASLINSAVTGRWLQHIEYEFFYVLGLTLTGIGLGTLTIPILWFAFWISGILGIAGAGILSFSYLEMIFPWEVYTACFFTASLWTFIWNRQIRERTARDDSIKRKERHDAAQAVQESLIPDARDIASIEYSAYYKAAEVTGGDWYGIYQSQDSQRIFLFIGDVTGHGFSSALLTATVAGCIKSTLSEVDENKLSAEESLQLVARRTNQVIYKTGAKAKHLMTMALACIDLQDRSLFYMNAGHRPLFLIRKGAVTTLLQGGSVLGFLEDFFSDVKRYPLQKDDLIFFFTDGLTENEGPNGEILSNRKLKKALKGHNDVYDVVKDLQSMSAGIWQDQEPLDDCTYFAIKILDFTNELDKAPHPEAS